MTYFHNAVKIISETLCIHWERQCAERELLDALRHTVCDITRCNVIEMTICVHTVNGVIKNRQVQRMITTALAVSIFVCSAKIVV